MRSRCGRDDGEPHRVELHGLRLGDHGRLDRGHAPEPRSLLLARCRASQRAGAGRADAPHAHAGHAPARRPGRGGARRHGRRRPAADDGPARHRPRGRRVGAPGARRSTALGGAGRGARPAARPGLARVRRLDRDRCRGALRALGHEVALVEPRTPPSAGPRSSGGCPDGSYEGGADPRADSLAAST